MCTKLQSILTVFANKVSDNPKAKNLCSIAWCLIQLLETGKRSTSKSIYPNSTTYRAISSHAHALDQESDFFWQKMKIEDPIVGEHWETSFAHDTIDEDSCLVEDREWQSGNTVKSNFIAIDAGNILHPITDKTILPRYCVFLPILDMLWRNSVKSDITYIGGMEADNVTTASLTISLREIIYAIRANKFDDIDRRSLCLRNALQVSLKAVQSWLANLKKFSNTLFELKQ